MAHYREAFVGIDVAKLKNAIAVAKFWRDGEIRYFGGVEVISRSISNRASIRLTASSAMGEIGAAFFPRLAYAAMSASTKNL